MSTRITSKSISALEKFWDDATFADRILALRGVDVLGDTAKLYADRNFSRLPSEVCSKLIRGAR